MRCCHQRCVQDSTGGALCTSAVLTVSPQTVMGAPAFVLLTAVPDQKCCSAHYQLDANLSELTVDLLHMLQVHACRAAWYHQTANTLCY